ncbi:alpha/beta-hydrolase [Cryphonectria parasitica EP155]|uniref:Alpha/beta-hydrolase n=1 Tax=Cryphonectria parasitica (strain ATCC 38755 / EP155) TaxID=660469 RepID=A0A9P4Y8P6_CRYP1|nr:alpha/beta-hydrolase [Cryphonectria parasitica EP155]KAF3769012.1 alpha/beta-hydrolase [Cryphonectria parasitica EP155]
MLGIAGLASLYHLISNLSLQGQHGGHHHPHHGHHHHHHHHHHPGPGSPYGTFPQPDDPFRFLPCTNKTLPPALEDKDHEASWAGLFDPEPDHWSWAEKNPASMGDSSSIRPKDPYAGRGIFLCGYLDVPLDYLNATETRTVRIAVTKLQVSGLSRLDRSSPPGSGVKSKRTLLIEPGGPGGSGTEYTWRTAQDRTLKYTNGTFDVLGWDPRGVNTSQPAISCYPYDADRDRWHMLTDLYREESADPDTLLRWADTMNNATFHACWKKFGDLGRFMTTALVARDLDEIRKALGEEQLDGYFVSYGTGIGQTYANMFPDRVGRLILDGTEYVRDHRLLGGFGWTALDNVTNAWHDGFLGECVHAGPEHCWLAKPHGGEPVTLESLDLRMRTLIDSLITQPVPGYHEESGPSLVTYRGLVHTIYAALYNPVTWPTLAQTLYELEQGNSTLATSLIEKNDWEYDPTRFQPPSPRPSSDELSLMVICADSYDAPLPPEGLAWWSSLWANMTTKSWISGNDRFYAVLPCRHFTTYWPDVAEVYRGDLNHTLAHPVLLIAEVYDPATPLRNGRRLLHEMGENARLIVHHGYGHSTRDLSTCTDSLARAYILNGTVPTERETACFADRKPYLPAPGRQGVDPVEVWREHVESLAGWAP